MTLLNDLGCSRVDHLDIARLPENHVSRLLLELTRNGLGLPVSLPVLVARGRRPGPTFGVTSGVHGNELNGIPVIHRLFQRLELSKLRGTLIGVPVVNVSGYHRERRKFWDGVDLNHIMPGVADGNSSQVYAHRLVDRLLSSFDHLVDLHTASFGRVNSLYVRADMSHETTARMAYLQRPQIILHNPPSDHTFRGAAMEMDIPAITLEIGDPHLFQPSLIQRSLVGLRAVIADVKMLPKRPISLGAPPIVCNASSWLYTDDGGLLEVFPDVCDRIPEGQVIARLSNIFGDVLQEYRAPWDCIVIGKSVNPVAQTGARIAHLGRVCDPAEHGFYGREALTGAGESS